ncbi:MAG TPA: hypothetical protein VGD87_04575 [Archangium sp.]
MRHLSSLFVLTLCARAWAADVSVYSNTLVGGRPDVVDGQVRTVVPLYQLVGVRAKNITVPGFDTFGVAVDAWGGLTLPGGPGGLAAGDVNLAYVDAATFKNRLRLRLGRQFVVGGVARAMYFDGLFAEYRSGVGLGLSAFTGIPVERRFGNYLNPDFVVGTRAFFAPNSATEVGASFIHAMNTNAGQLVRQDAGLDLRWKPFRFLDVSGAFVWSIADMRLAEFDVGPRWRPHQSVEVLLNYRRTAPDLFLPRTSIFTVFTDMTRDEAGGTVTWAPLSWTRFYADGRAIWLQGELGMEASARAQLQPFRSPSTTLVAQYRRLSIPSNGFHQARLGARHVTAYGFGLAVDLETYVLDQAVRGQTVSFSASASATYTINKSLFVAATVFAATTPTFESRYEAIAKLTWLFPDGGHL